jgi:hypothetical protein
MWRGRRRRRYQKSRRKKRPGYLLRPKALLNRLELLHLFRRKQSASLIGETDRNLVGRLPHLVQFDHQFPDSRRRRIGQLQTW